MDILKHFENDTKSDVILFCLKDDEWGEFLSKLPNEYKNCFITDEELKSRIVTFNSTKEKEFSEILPTEGKIKSGDFGEILSYFFFKELYKDKKIDGPKKWRWKESQNVATPYSDVILFSINNAEYSEDDLLISVESKMKATKKKYSENFLNDPKKDVRIQEAINGAQKDYISRMAKSMSWLRKRYKDESLKEGAQKDRLVQLVNHINRFIQSEGIPTYKKQVKAIAFIDKKILDYEMEQNIAIPHEPGMDLEIYVVGVKDLKEMYEKVYFEIPNL